MSSALLAEALEYRLSFASGALSAGEDVLLDVVLHNRGAEELRVPDPESPANWQPTFTVEGPGPEDRLTFDRLAIAQGRPSRPLPDSAASLLTLPARGAWRGRLPLSRLVAMGRPGRYRVTSRLVWGELSVEAEPAEVEIEPLVVEAASVGLGGTSTGSPEIAATWIHRGPRGRALFLGEFEAGLGGAPVRRSVTRVADLGPAATAVLSPVAERSLREDWFSWAAVRDGRELSAFPTNGDAPARLALDREPFALLHPAIQHPSHDLDLFVIAGARLSLARFQDGDFTADAAGGVVWTHPLPFSPSGGAVAVQPGTGARVRHLLFATEDRGRGSVQLHHAIVDGRGPPRGFAVETVESAALLADAPPALFVRRSGAALCAVLARSPDDARRCRVVEAVFQRKDASDGAGSITPVELPEPAEAARIGYHRFADGSSRRGWVIRGRSGALWTDGLRRAREASTGPLHLLVLAHGSYLLEPARAGGLSFAPL